MAFSMEFCLKMKKKSSLNKMGGFSLCIHKEISFIANFENAGEEKSNHAMGYLNIKFHELFILKLRHTTTPALLFFCLAPPHQWHQRCVLQVLLFLHSFFYCLLMK
jgi:hypothetical protein